MERDQQLKMKRKNGFTLLELLVATSLTVILLLAVSSVFMTFLLADARTNLRRQIQSEGAEMISRMEFLLRNSKTVTCDPIPNPVIDFVTIENNAIRITKNGTELLYTLGGGSPILLNSVNSQIDSLTFTCTEDTTTKKRVVVIDLVVKHKDSLVVKEKFKSYVQIRNS